MIGCLVKVTGNIGNGANHLSFNVPNEPVIGVVVGIKKNEDPHLGTPTIYEVLLNDGRLVYKTQNFLEVVQ